MKDFKHQSMLQHNMNIGPVMEIDMKECNIWREQKFTSLIQEAKKKYIISDKRNH